MSFLVAGAIAAGGAIVGGIGGAIISGNDAKDAAKTQADAATSAADLQHQQFEQQRQDQQPWRQAGTQALSQMQDPSFQHQFSSADFQADPGYAFRLQQGQQALERSAAARGGLQTGGTLRSLSDYAQGSASQEYQNAYNRFTNNQTNSFNRLASLAGIGQTANNQIGQAGMNMANNVGNEITGAANAQGAAKIAQGNMWGNTLSSLGSGAGKTWMDAQQMNSMNNFMNRMLPQAPAAAPAVPMAGESYGSLSSLA